MQISKQTMNDFDITEKDINGCTNEDCLTDFIDENKIVADNYVAVRSI
jgi:hypothetical protein